MLLYRIDCDECGAPRVGKKENGKVETFQANCPVCGSPSYSVPDDEDV